MAAAHLEEIVQEGATCSICLDFFTEPVTTGCGHNFCHPCISKYVADPSANFSCPQCKRTSDQATLRTNVQLGTMADRLKRLSLQRGPEGGQFRCQKHDERLKVFCRDDQRAICVVCSLSREHSSHTAVPVEEAAQEFKRTLQSWQRFLDKELDELKVFTSNQRKKAARMEDSIKSQRQRIVGVFEELQQFLKEEQRLHLTRLEKEHNEILKRIRGSVTQQEGQMSYLKNLIADVEGTIQQRDLELIQDVKSVLTRCENVNVQKPESDTSQQEAKIYQLLEQRVDLKKLVMEYMEWKDARRFAVDIHLDPDTAHPNLVIATDQKSVRIGDKRRNLDSNLKRFIYYPIILGCEGFNTGKHYWEVDVGDMPAWDVGVCEKSVSRKAKDINLSPEEGCWRVYLRDGNQYWAGSAPDIQITPKEKPRIIGVFLDYEEGKVSFYSVNGKSLLFRFLCNFSQILLPYFYPGSFEKGRNAGILRINPVTG
ncbi:E3 ubiquitin-protein ligase TRIM39-like isoform X1 [Pleurodeles waltl]|uniref:E3 ubiquitin-protein ligase TRIM39-like isoform X1 n=1 Tax=Pleurodeles waltl TaxID=8319 RepID=UPI0037093DB0